MPSAQITTDKVLTFAIVCSVTAFLTAGGCFAQDRSKQGQSPADHLPDHIKRVTHFGERADWSHDGKRILFLGKTFGDAFEVELASGIIRPVTAHYFHEGYVRALYLANGDILLSGAKEFDADNPWRSRADTAELWVLDKSLAKPPVRLGMKCSEGPAVSRKKMRIAWTLDHGDYPDRIPKGASQTWMGDITDENGAPRLVNQKLVLDSRSLPFKCSLECQNWRPPDEKELTFSAYGHQGADVAGVNIESGKVTNYSEAPDQYDEPEGIFPDGKCTLVESDRQNRKGSQYVDVWKLWLDGSHRMERLTYFSDYAGYKSSNPVVSDDGNYMAFQMARVGDPAGVGRGIFVYDLRKAPQGK
ncbi:hypothetical protein FJY63_07965 [Candidatus Sumerlaeota bacterium]|nr:hypothetical protein [Candidatus Sumerlaeota bacterium]